MTVAQAEPSVKTAGPPRGRRRHRVWTLVKVVVVVGVAASGAYWLRFAPVPVTAFTLKPGVVVAEVMGTGTLEARVSATVSPKISGRIMEVLVDEGDRVKAGQTLFRLDDSELKRQVEMAESTLAAAQAAVARQEAEVASAQAVLDKARYDYDRVTRLLKQENAASDEFQDATKALRMGEADLKRTEAALGEARSQVTVAERTLGYHQARRADTVVTAPFHGLVARRDRDPGDVVVPGASVLLLLNTDEMWVSAWVDETEMARLGPDQPARVVFRSESQRSYPGHVVRLAREADRETREFQVDVSADALPANWAVGQRAEVYIEVARATEVLTAPLKTIVWRDGAPGVFIEGGGRALWRAVRLGIRGTENVEVREGIAAAGERIVLPRGAAARLGDGQRVTVR
jgi:HlyD family secretion protein